MFVVGIKHLLKHFAILSLIINAVTIAIAITITVVIAEEFKV